jgi:hypothetical protein
MAMLMVSIPFTKRSSVGQGGCEVMQDGNGEEY